MKPSVGERERAKYEAMGQKYGVSLDVEMTEPMQEEVMETSNGLLRSDNTTNIISQDVVMNNEGQEEEGGIRINEVTSMSDTSKEDEDDTLSQKRPELRFLPGMEVRVSDKCEDAVISGQCGIVAGDVSSVIRPWSVRVYFKNSILVKVEAENLEPSLPEEGDMVMTLVEDTPDCPGTVQSIDDEDNASVKFLNGDTHTFPLEKLCKSRRSYHCNFPLPILEVEEVVE